MSEIRTMKDLVLEYLDKEDPAEYSQMLRDWLPHVEIAVRQSLHDIRKASQATHHSLL